MGDFHGAVSTLIEAFTHGLAIIRSFRQRRKESKAEADSTVKTEEVRLRKSLKKNRADVRNTYALDAAKLGRRFSEGDVKAQSSITSILFRLNAGFVNIIDRFTRGESTRDDYRTLLNLSNSSRAEAMKTFEQLSLRLSRSQVLLSSSKPKRSKAGGSKKQKGVAASSSVTSSAVTRSRHARSKSAPEASTKRPVRTPTTSQALVVRRKGQKKIPNVSGDLELSQHTNESRYHSSSQEGVEALDTFTSAKRGRLPLSVSATGPNSRMSIMSFASDSTKIGEIPIQRMPRPLAVSLEHEDQLANTVFPLAPWTKPEKPRSRFMRLFRK